MSTAEWEPTAEKPGWPSIELDIVAAEVMWDAVLASVPGQPPRVPPASASSARASGDLGRLTGEYVFSPQVSVRITARGSALLAQASGARDAYAIGKAGSTELIPVRENTFTVPGRYPLVLEFRPPDSLVINPGHWQQVGARRRP